MASCPSETISLWEILSKSRSIVRLHREHFQALTILFCFPLSLCLIYYPISQAKFPKSLSNFTHLTESPYLYLLFILLHTVFESLFSLCAVATILFSTYRVISEEPLVLVESIKSIYKSFLPILCTQIVVGFVVSLISIPCMVLVLLAYKWLHSYGVEDISSLQGYFLIFVMIIALVCIVLVIYLQVNLILAYVVVVVESKRGYEALKRSVYLIKGNRGVALSVLLLYGLVSGLFYWIAYSTYWWSWAALFHVIWASIFVSWLLLWKLVASVVLYVDCRDLHEGLPFKDEKNCPLLN